jgi:phage terminase small subunit
MALNRKQRLFVREYMKDRNATQAAIRSGYAKKNADVTGPRLLGNVGVRAEIDRLCAERDKRLELSRDNVILEMKRIAFAKVTRFARWKKDGTVDVRPSSSLSEDDVAAIQEISATPNGPKVKLHSKDRALRELAKILGLYKDREPLESLLERFLAVLPASDATLAREFFARLLANRSTGEAGGSGP